MILLLYIFLVFFVLLKLYIVLYDKTLQGTKMLGETLIGSVRRKIGPLKAA